VQILFNGGEVERLEELQVNGGEAGLPFYSSVRLCVLNLKWQNKALPPLFLLNGADHAYPLDGSNAPVYAANEEEQIEITEETAEDYLRFFCFAVRGDEGPFLLYEALPAGIPESPGVCRIFLGSGCASI
jgi:hypothetical protein